MYLSDIKIEGYRLFKEKQILHLRKGLNVLVGENGCGKSTVIDAIRLLLNEDEYTRNGISEEDFYSSVDKKEWADRHGRIQSTCGGCFRLFTWERFIQQHDIVILK